MESMQIKIRRQSAIRWSNQEEETMKNIIRTGATLGAALLLAAAPFSFHWSPARTLSMSLDKADARKYARLRQ